MLVRGGRIGEVSLSLKPDAAPCPSISVSMSEPAQSLFRWELVVSARFPESTSRLGSILTIPPATTRPPNRVVLLAYAPGAKGWLVQCRAIAQVGEGVPALTSAQAEVWISRSECCGALSEPGVMPVEPVGYGAPLFEVVTGQHDLSSAGFSLIIAANPYRRRFVIENDAGAANPVAIGSTNGVTLANGKLLLPKAARFETTYRGAIFGIGTSGAPPVERVSWWAENG